MEAVVASLPSAAFVALRMLHALRWVETMLYCNTPCSAATRHGRAAALYQKVLITWSCVSPRMQQAEH